MKAIEREEIKKVIDGYEAADGTFFQSKEECQKYEESAIGVLRGRLAQKAIRFSTEYGLFETGSDECDAFVVIPKSKEDIDLVNQLALAINGSGDREIDDSHIGTVVIVYTGYKNDSCWFSHLSELVSYITDGKFTVKAVEE